MLLHRHHISTLLQALLVLFAFSSCIGDELGDGTAKGNATTPTECYLYLQIESDMNGSQTRADNTGSDETASGGFVGGEENEHSINPGSSFFIFFKENGELFPTKPIRRIEPLDDKLWEAEGNASYIEKGWLTKVYPDENASEEDKWPRKCLLVLNAPTVYEGLMTAYENGETLKLDNIVGDKWDGNDDPQNLGRYGDLFMMTNAVVGDQVATPIDPKKNIVKIKESADWGKDDNNDGNKNKADILRVRVERMSAKFSLGISKEHLIAERTAENENVFQPMKEPTLVMFTGQYGVDGAPKNEVKKWRIKVTGWNVNALETQNYLFKQNPASMPSNGTWTNESAYRSYWSKDPHYDNGADGTPLTYPWQYRWAMDSDLEYYAAKGDNNYLRNYSFKELGLDGVDEGIEKTIYAPENTYDAESVSKNNHDSRDEMLACTHLLIGAELQIEKEAGTDNYEALDVYRDRNGYYYETERRCIAALVHDLNQTLVSKDTMSFSNYNWKRDPNTPFVKPKRMVAGTTGNYSLYYKNGNDEWVPLTETVILDESQFSDKDLKMSIAELRKGDGKRLPWIDKLIKNEDDIRLAIGTAGGAIKPSVKVYDTMEGDYGALVADKTTERDATINEIKSLLYEWIGAVDHFDHGKMYYACGIYNPLSADDKSKIYGVVRNNWYQFNLNNIKCIGIPVDDVEQPIVPERLGLNDQINVTVKIIDWHHVKTTIPIID